MRSVPSPAFGALLIFALLGGGCAERLRVALGARDFMSRRGRCEVVSGSSVTARGGGRVDAVAPGEASLRCRDHDQSIRYRVETVRPHRLAIEGPRRLRATSRGVYELHAFDGAGRALEVGRAEWVYPENLSRSESCGHMLPLPCGQWLESTRVRALSGKRAELVAKLGDRRVSRSIEIEPSKHQSQIWVALGAQLPPARFGDCSKQRGQAVVVRGRLLVAAKPGSAQLACTAAGGAVLTALTITVLEPESIAIAGDEKPVVGSVDAEYQLRAAVHDDRLRGGMHVLRVGRLHWKHSVHFGPPKQHCIFANQLCVQPVHAGQGWVSVDFAGKTYRKAVRVRSSYRE